MVICSIIGLFHQYCNQKETCFELLQIFVTTGDLKSQEDCARIVHDSMEYFNGQLDVLVCFPALTVYGIYVNR